ncbi:unnamed protein product [Arabidopsis thaliana]|uniref:Uncharacterized protein n=1 Tax=Arabidopsis thaliana TaxID=3702 RepID=A0A654F5W5_ARATH|nr:unnamed protein product [Arabidopsis thaliana]
MLTRVWEDPWIPTILARPVKSILNIRDSLLYVNDFIDQNTNLWKLDRLQALIDPVDIPLILGIRPSRTYLSDGFSWSHTKSGNYTVKSGYWAARDLSRPTCDPPFRDQVFRHFRHKYKSLKLRGSLCISCGNVSRVV